jgi:hypothetical protein
VLSRMLAYIRRPRSESRRCAAGRSGTPR